MTINNTSGSGTGQMQTADFKEAYVDGWQKYVDFSGRTGRTFFWTFVLVNFCVSVILSIIDMVLGTGFIQFIWALAILLPSIAIFIRRLHDSDKTGWFALLLIIPLVNLIALIVFGIMEGTPGNNQYGAPPVG